MSANLRRQLRADFPSPDQIAGAQVATGSKVMKDYAMTSIANVLTVLFPPFEFSLALDRSYAVREKHGRGGGQFADLSTAIFIQDERQTHGSQPVTHFDRSLTFIRAGG
jgi:hypothetical protein